MGLALLLLSALLRAESHAAARWDALTPVRAFRAFDRSSAPELPESIVVDLLQDADGVLWIATLGGLATYDGAALLAVRDPEAPRGVALLAARREGGLYAVSRRGLHVFDGRWRRLGTNLPVRSLAEEGGRWLWTVQGESAWKTPADAAQPAWQRVELPAALGVPQALLSDHDDGIFVIGSERILRCRDGACVPVPGSGRRPERASAALASRSGALWLGTADGRLAVARPGASDWATIDVGPWPSDGIRSLAEDRQGRVWAGGLARLCHGAADGSAWTCWGPDAGLPNSAILSLLGDREGTLWLGLNGAGLRQWVGQAWTHATRWPADAAPASGLDVIGIAPSSDGGLLASAFGRGILRWDGRRLAAWGRADGLQEDVRAVVEPAPGVVWAGARHGVFEKQAGGRFRRTLALPVGFASGFARDPDGVWHVWTDAHGVFRRAGRWEHAPEIEALVPAASVRALVWSPTGDLWIATPAELVGRRRSGMIERHALGLERGLPDSASALLADRPDELWAGGQGGMALLQAGRWRLFGDADGVPGNVYFLRRAPDGGLWVGGSRGIARMRDGRFTSWDRSSGLIADECNSGALVLPDGTLLAATSGSLARFDPAVAEPPAAPLRVAWQEPVEARHAPLLRRAADERRLVVGWRAPWLAPQPVEYSTRVAGGAWSAPTRNTQLTVESLPAGRSEIAVRARRKGLAGEAWTAPTTLQVEIAPHAWERLPARAAAVLLVAGLMLAGAHLNARRAHARREQALDRMRSDFMASASHELRTPIAQIRLFADMLRLGRTRGEGERAEALDTIHRATRRLEALAANLLQLARGKAGAAELAAQPVDLAGLLLESTHDLAPLAAASGATLQLDVEPGLRGHVDVEGLRRVVSNLVENALKYGPAGQVVHIAARQTAAGLRLVVEDQGPGIPPAERERVWDRFARLERDRNSAVGGTGLGLAVVREAVARAGGEAHIEDVTPTGTRLVVLLPQPGAAP